MWDLSVGHRTHTAGAGFSSSLHHGDDSGHQAFEVDLKFSACLCCQQISILLLRVSAEGMKLEPVLPAENKQKQMGNRKILRVFVINLAQCKYCMFSAVFFSSPVWVPDCGRAAALRLTQRRVWKGKQTHRWNGECVRGPGNRFHPPLLT